MSILTLSLYAQSVTVRGTVSDANGDVLQGVSIAVKGSTSGAVSDANGNYSISVADKSAVLVFSFVGFVKQEIAVGERTELNVTLEEDMQELDELVVVGYGTQKKVNLSGAVSTISAKALASRNVTNANVALQGLAPNMNITRGSGRADQTPGINIRGYTSINGGEAFILVDNVPTSASEFARINPSDIENISVLKDASSAAIYGARAAFGVVLVTTKTANNGKLQIDADYTYGLRQYDNMPQILTDLPEFMRIANIMTNELRYNDAAIEYAEKRMADPSLPEVLGPGAENGGLNPRLMSQGRWEYYGMYNWYDEIIKDASPSQTANVRIAQKTEKLAYSISGGMYTESGMLNIGNDDYKRFNLRANGTYNITDRWTLGTNTTFSRMNYYNTYDSGEGDYILFRAFGMYPEQPLYNPDGTLTTDVGRRFGNGMSGSHIRTIIDETQMSFNTRFDILKDVWSVSGDATFRSYNENKNRVEISVASQDRPNGTNTPGNHNASGNRNLNRLTVYNLYTNFNKTFARNHFVSAMMGFNQEHFMYDNVGISGQNLITPSVPDIELTQNNRTFSHGTEEYALRGAFGRLTYIFGERYIIEGNARYDGTSRFAKKNRFGFFPSYSVAWVLSKERFMEGVNRTIKLSNLKFRFSDGTLGSQANLGYYPTIAGMGLTGQIGHIIDGSRPQAMNPPGSTPGALTWEKVRSVNGGIDLGFFDNRLDLTADIYTRYTEGMLTDTKTLPGVFGTGSPRGNVADLKTKGWDLSIGWRDEVNVGGSPLSYRVRFMLWDHRAWITRFDNPTKNLGNYYEGQELGEIWGYTTIGYFASDAEAAAWADQNAINNTSQWKAGDIKFADLNRDYRINEGSNTVDDPGDRTVIGNNRERFPYSIDLSGEWKGFDLRIFLQGVGKRDVYPHHSTQGYLFWGIYTTPWSGASIENLDHWTEDNPNAFFPRLKTTGRSQGLGWDYELSKRQTKYLQDASYLRVKNVTLGYTVPSLRWLQKAKVRNLRVYFSGENILTFHHIQVKGNDPENFGNGVLYPLQRTFSFGLNIGF
jgi:TonB-linked SusC/RagA family outer membrane protein